MNLKTLEIVGEYTEGEVIDAIKWSSTGVFASSKSGSSS